MAIPKGARTGLLLFLTAGPFLVFLFLQIFGKNKYEVDTYPTTLSRFCYWKQPLTKPLLLLDEDPASYGFSKNQYLKQLDRLHNFWEKTGSSPTEATLVHPSDQPAGKEFKEGEVLLQGLPWLSVDTVLKIQTAKGPVRKRLPKPPRAFLFDQNQNLRGVYGLCNHLSVDTILLEYTILIDK